MRKKRRRKKGKYEGLRKERREEIMEHDLIGSTIPARLRFRPFNPNELPKLELSWGGQSTYSSGITGSRKEI